MLYFVCHWCADASEAKNNIHIEKNARHNPHVTFECVRHFTQLN